MKFYIRYGFLRRGFRRPNFICEFNDVWVLNELETYSGMVDVDDEYSFEYWFAIPKDSQLPEVEIIDGAAYWSGKRRGPSEAQLEELLDDQPFHLRPFKERADD